MIEKIKTLAVFLFVGVTILSSVLTLAEICRADETESFSDWGEDW